MSENFIMERYKSRHFASFHFVFTVNYICNKNALYGIVSMCVDYVHKVSLHCKISTDIKAITIKRKVY